MFTLTPRKCETIRFFVLRGQVWGSFVTDAASRPGETREGRRVTGEHWHWWIQKCLRSTSGESGETGGHTEQRASPQRTPDQTLLARVGQNCRRRCLGIEVLFSLSKYCFYFFNSSFLKVRTAQRDVCAHACVCPCICVCASLCVCMHLYVCVCLCMCVHVCVYMCVHVCACVRCTFVCLPLPPRPRPSPF